MSAPWGHTGFPVMPLGRVADIQLGKMLQPAAGSDADAIVSYLRAGSISSLNNVDALPTMYASPSDIRQYQVVAGDLIVAEGGDCGQTGFAPCLLTPTIIQNSLHRVRSHTGDIRFIRYSLDSIYSTGWLDVLCSKSTFGHLTREKLVALPVPWPTPEAQCAIADYLDRETARIDALIAAKRRIVKLLEKRWATVRCRLTRVGESSNGWRSVQLRRVARVQAGAAFPHENQGDARGTIPYVKVGDLANVDKDDRLIGASNRIAPEVATALRSPILPTGTIVLPKIGAALLTNRRAVLSEPSCLDQNVMGVTVHAGQPRFVYYCLASIDLGNLSTPGPVPLLNEEAALSVQIPWPRIEEQDAVVRALDAHSVAAKAPVDAVVSQIALLQERRQALITAAVTGQLDIVAAA